ncbi:MAG: hypothetical protein H0V80_10530 [Acidobacteria bacterium]|nr:hypothetical protein [Acidobacteriota bacterium]
MLEPLEEYGAAAIAADHTGDEIPIADLLQALDDERNLDVSYSSLARLQKRQSLEPVARAFYCQTSAMRSVRWVVAARMLSSRPDSLDAGLYLTGWSKREGLDYFINRRAKENDAELDGAGTARGWKKVRRQSIHQNRLLA